MPFAFTTLSQGLTVSTKDGHNFVLLEPLVYITNDNRTLRVVAGATTDGASVPPPLWNLLPPFGEYWLAAVLHDGLYRDNVQELVNNNWVKKTCLKEECDSLLLEAMLSLNVDPKVAKAIYKGVALGGEHSYQQDRK